VSGKDDYSLQTHGEKIGYNLMIEFRNPIPVTTSLGDGMAIYVVNSATILNEKTAFL
jgi:hypothetical protein